MHKDDSNPTNQICGIVEPKVDKSVCVKSSIIYENWNGDNCRNVNRVVKIVKISLELFTACSYEIKDNF